MFLLTTATNLLEKLGLLLTKESVPLFQDDNLHDGPRNTAHLHFSPSSSMRQAAVSTPRASLAPTSIQRSCSTQLLLGLLQGFLHALQLLLPILEDVSSLLCIQNDHVYLVSLLGRQSQRKTNWGDFQEPHPTGHCGRRQVWSAHPECLSPCFLTLLISACSLWMVGSAQQSPSCCS